MSDLLFADWLLQKMKFVAGQLNFVFVYVDLDHYSHVKRYIRKNIFKANNLTI